MIMKQIVWTTLLIVITQGIKILGFDHVELSLVKTGISMFWGYIHGNANKWRGQIKVIGDFTKKDVVENFIFKFVCIYLQTGMLLVWWFVWPSIIQNLNNCIFASQRNLSLHLNGPNFTRKKIIRSSYLEQDCSSRMRTTPIERAHFLVYTVKIV